MKTERFSLLLVIRRAIGSAYDKAELWVYAKGFALMLAIVLETGLQQRVVVDLQACSRNPKAIYAEHTVDAARPPHGSPELQSLLDAWSYGKHHVLTVKLKG